MFKFRYLLFSFFLFLSFQGDCLSASVKVVDAKGKTVAIERIPRRVVSLVPSMTEILFKLGVGDLVRGITYHDVHLPELSGKKIIGGFFEPSVSAIEAVNPDMIILSSIHNEVKEKFS